MWAKRSKVRPFQIGSEMIWISPDLCCTWIIYIYTYLYDYIINISYIMFLCQLLPVAKWGGLLWSIQNQEFSQIQDCSTPQKDAETSLATIFLEKWYLFLEPPIHFHYVFGGSKNRYHFSDLRMVRKFFYLFQPVTIPTIAHTPGGCLASRPSGVSVGAFFLFRHRVGFGSVS